VRLSVVWCLPCSAQNITLLDTQRGAGGHPKHMTHYLLCALPTNSTPCAMLPCTSACFKLHLATMTHYLLLCLACTNSTPCAMLPCTSACFKLDPATMTHYLLLCLACTNSTPCAMLPCTSACFNLHPATPSFLLPPFPPTPLRACPRHLTHTQTPSHTPLACMPTPPCRLRSCRGTK